MPVAGAAAPVTVAGALAQTTAESLALCAITLAVDDRLLGVSSGALVMDMRDASHRQSGPDVMLHRMAAMQMNAYLFGGRFTLPGFNTGAQVVCPQALYEKAIGTALSIAGGDRSVGIGSLACSDVGSLVQLMLDYEMGLFFKNLFRDVTVDDERIGEETILATAPRGAFYLDSDHTARFFRDEMWFPAFMDFRNPLSWMKDPSDMIARAREKAREMVRTAKNQCPLSEAQKAEIRRLVAAADHEAEGTGRR
jgi:trimethylamine--corrinoid protein Co-methyltransferase